MVKSWKSHEKRVTEWYSKISVPAIRLSKGRRGEAVMDVRWGAFSIDDKTRKMLPQWLHKMMAQAEKNSEGLIPVIHLHQDNTRTENDYVVMRASDFRELGGFVNERKDEWDS